MFMYGGGICVCWQPSESSSFISPLLPGRSFTSCASVLLGELAWFSLLCNLSNTQISHGAQIKHLLSKHFCHFQINSQISGCNLNVCSAFQSSSLSPPDFLAHLSCTPANISSALFQPAVFILDTELTKNSTCAALTTKIQLIPNIKAVFPLSLVKSTVQIEMFSKKYYLDEPLDTKF